MCVCVTPPPPPHTHTEPSPSKRTAPLCICWVHSTTTLDLWTRQPSPSNEPSAWIPPGRTLSAAVWVPSSVCMYTVYVGTLECVHVPCVYIKKLVESIEAPSTHCNGLCINRLWLIYVHVHVRTLIILFRLQ